LKKHWSRSIQVDREARGRLLFFQSFYQALRKTKPGKNEILKCTCNICKAARSVYNVLKVEYLTFGKHSLATIKFMKKLTTISVMLLLMLLSFKSNAQEKYGRTLNLGLGIGGYSGYYGYVGRTMPVFSINYELDIARNFTLAPFVSFYSFSANHSSYAYRETVIPVGVKGTYYFDELLSANHKWDFYLASSLGLAIVNSRWEEGYTGDRNYYHDGSSLFLDAHIGAEYHFNSRLGAFLDLSTGVSTIGLAVYVAR
jgi:hypothetical protein